MSRGNLPSRPAPGDVVMVLQIVAVLVGVGCLTVPYFFACLLLLPWRARRVRLGNWVGATSGRWANRVVGLSREVRGHDPAALAPALFVQNHSSTLDLWLAMQLCPAPGVGTMKQEVLWVPFPGIG